MLFPNTSVKVTGFRFDQLLPSNRDYYFYKGSFTSPPCYEIVGWFVMKNRITVPGAYLNELRKAECGGELLGFNFRTPQELGDRVVTTVGENSAVTMQLQAFTMIFCLVVLKLL